MVAKEKISTGNWRSNSIFIEANELWWQKRLKGDSMGNIEFTSGHLTSSAELATASNPT
jgi:hypothetical protein